jgi:ABC-2 type transport system permease protein
MRGYISYFKAELKAGLQYKTAALSGLTTQFFWGIIFALVYTSFYRHTAIQDINLSQLMDYVWLNQAFLTLIYIGLNDEAIIGSIKDGTVAYELLRPYDLYTWWYVKLVARRYALVMLRCMPILVFAYLLPEPYNLSLPFSVFTFLMFVLTMFLGTILVSTINMIVNSLAFFTNENRGISSIIYTIADLLEGSQIPLPLLSGVVLVIASFTPFRFIEDLPFRLYSGHIDIRTGFREIGIELIWILGLLIIGRLIMKKALSKVSIQGG